MDWADLLTEALETSGQVRLSSLLATLLPIEQLRELARVHGLSPKGGYRLQTASAGVLAPLLADPRRPDVLAEVCKALAARLTAPPAVPRPQRAPAATEVATAVQRQLETQRAEADKARKAAARERERGAARVRELELERENAARLRAEIAALQRQLEGRLAPTDADRNQRRVHELERELETSAAAEEALRLRVAEQAARIRRLEAEVEELASKIPTGRRARRKSLPAPPAAPFRLPRFAPSFYKSLEDKNRRSVEKAVQAVLLFCAEGPSYPGLEVKQLESHALWSLRASLKLRVLFAMRDDGDIDVLELVDRGDQHTALRRWKER